MYNYRVKVRQQTYLYGGANVKTEAGTFNSNLVLFMRVDDLGEDIKFGIRRKKDGAVQDLGTLRPGESYALKLEDVSGVYATASDENDTTVECSLLSNRI